MEEKNVEENIGILQKNAQPVIPVPLNEKTNSSQEIEQKRKEKKAKLLNDHYYMEQTLNLFNGELISFSGEATFIKGKSEKNADIIDANFSGVIVFTDFRFIFHFFEKNSENEKYKEDFFIIPYLLIKDIKKDNIIFNLIPFTIVVRDGRELKFYLSIENNKDDEFFKKILEKVNYIKKSNLTDLPLKFNSYINSYLKGIKSEFNGWEIYDFYKEFKRQGLDFKDPKFNFPLRVSTINEKFECIDSYPRNLIEPKDIGDEILKLDSKFREIGRIPTLTYNYNNNYFFETTEGLKKLISGIWCSSQVSSGIFSSENKNDISLLDEIAKLGYKFYIFDARSEDEANKKKLLKGGGAEDVEYYKSFPKLTFCNIETVDASDDALEKLQKLCMDKEVMTNKNFWSKLQESGWLDFIMINLKISTDISKLVYEGNNVLVHCTEGRNRTPKLVTISQILLDHYYRTFEGFAVLIEKDFLSFGHQFAKRRGILDGKADKIKINSIFIQFLDGVYQLMVQFPSQFEFNREYLLFIAKSFEVNLYGTFFFDSEKERNEKNAKIITASIWTYLFSKKENYMNHLYNPKNIKAILIPKYGYYNYRLWTDYFMRNNINAEE